jgi:hypothetical protein
MLSAYQPGCSQLELVIKVNPVFSIGTSEFFKIKTPKCPDDVEASYDGIYKVVSIISGTGATICTAVAVA